MPETLDYARQPKHLGYPKVGWVACFATIVISFGVAIGSLHLAYRFRNTPVVDPVVGPWRYWFVDKQLNYFVCPLALMLAGFGCFICWSQRTGRWLGLAALLIGAAGWLGAVVNFP
jgi:hypothetical protein